MSRQSNPSHPKRTREEKEEELIQGIEQLLGFPLVAWQRPVLTEFLRSFQAGNPIDFTAISRARRDV